MCSFDNLYVLVALCNVAMLLPAPFLRLLPSELEKDPEEGSGGGGGKRGDGSEEDGLSPVELLETRALLQEVEQGGQTGFDKR